MPTVMSDAAGMLRLEVNVARLVGFCVKDQRYYEGTVVDSVEYLSFR
jgi:hypothetical protein